MRKLVDLTILLIFLALGGNTVAAFAAPARNEEVTKRHFAALVADHQPKLAELTLFLTMMPKGGDLHHHYVGAVYAEQFLEWVDKQSFCINKLTYRVETDPVLIAAERAKPVVQRNCLSAVELSADNVLYQELLQRWSTKDFYNHVSLQSPPDRTFFDTFSYFMPVVSPYANEGLMTLKQRAIQENLSYIETIFELAPSVLNADFDTNVLGGGIDDATLGTHLSKLFGTLEKDQSFSKSIQNYVDYVKTSSVGVDDEKFTMRYQAYVLRYLTPSQMFSSMVASFKAASLSPLIVGVNIVGEESAGVSMRDYSMHMQMFKFLKAKYPAVKVALHAGELALGMVPPEGLTFHIDEAVSVAGANRIGHGMDIVHESKALDTIKIMRQRGIAVEVNLSSNEFILGIKGDAHPVTLYRKYGVPFVISTDDAGVSRNNLTNEYVLFASRYKADYAEVKRLSYDSLRYSFLSKTDKQRLLKDLDVRFERFEADIAAWQAAIVKP